MGSFEALLKELDNYLMSLKQHLLDDKVLLLEQSIDPIEESNTQKLILKNKIEVVLEKLAKHPEWEQAQELGLLSGLEKALKEINTCMSINQKVLLANQLHCLRILKCLVNVSTEDTDLVYEVK
jgi:hypothetical protein